MTTIKTRKLKLAIVALVALTALFAFANSDVGGVVQLALGRNSSVQRQLDEAAKFRDEPEKQIPFLVNAVQFAPNNSALKLALKNELAKTYAHASHREEAQRLFEEVAGSVGIASGSFVREARRALEPGSIERMGRALQESKRRWARINALNKRQYEEEKQFFVNKKATIACGRANCLGASDRDQFRAMKLRHERESASMQ